MNVEQYSPNWMREGGQCPPVHLEESELSVAFIEARSKVWKQNELVWDLRRSGASEEEIDAADAEWRSLAEIAVDILDSDREQVALDEQEARREQALAEPFEAKVKLAVATLRLHGPMTATDMSGRGLKGLSNNYIRPVLQEAQRRGLVERVQSGRRVLWVPTL